jgi:hypothetical protein
MEMALRAWLRLRLRSVYVSFSRWTLQRLIRRIFLSISLIAFEGAKTPYFREYRA